MNASYDKNAAIVVLPAVSLGRLEDVSLRTWLARSDLTREPVVEEILARIVRELALPYPQHGLAALRLWGQTGDRATSWIAAADPVYLEPRLDHLCLHALRRAGVDLAQIRTLIDHLQAELADDGQIGFTRLRRYGYLSAKTPIATATVPAYVVDQQRPDDYLPSGDDTASHRNLLSEIEMALHEHEINLAREARGELPVNSLWLWGGGFAPEPCIREQPPLFSDNALLTGYWYSATADAERWTGSIEACIDESDAGFVAEIPEFDESPQLLENSLRTLCEALHTRRLSSLTMLFRDGIRAHVRRSHNVRFWRRNSPLLEATGAQ